MNEIPALVQHDFIFPEEKILNCVGIIQGDKVYTHERDMCARRRTAKLIQQIGIGSKCSQIVANTAIIMMHRLFMYWPSYKLPLGKVAAACFFLAAKIEDTPRRLNFVVAKYFQYERGVTDMRLLSKEEISSVSDEIVLLESLMLPCLGFTLKITQPHQILIRGCRDLNLPKILWQTAYYNCTNLLHLTIMVLRLRPETLAAACVQMAASWSEDPLPPPTDAGKHWFNFFDVNMTQDSLKTAVDECIREFGKVPMEAKQTVKKLARSTPTQFQVNQITQRAQQKRQQEREAAAVAAASSSSNNPVATTGSSTSTTAGNPVATGGAESSAPAPASSTPAAAAAAAAAASQKLSIDEYKRRRQGDSSSSAPLSAPTTPGSTGASATPASSFTSASASVCQASAAPPVPSASTATPTSSKPAYHHHPQHHPHQQQNQNHLPPQHHQQKPHQPSWLPHHNAAGKQQLHGPPPSSASGPGVAHSSVHHHKQHHQHHHNSASRLHPGSLVPHLHVGSGGAKRSHHLMITSGDINSGGAAVSGPAGPGGSGDPSQLKRHKSSTTASASAASASSGAPSSSAATVPPSTVAGHFYNAATATTTKQHQ